MKREIYEEIIFNQKEFKAKLDYWLGVVNGGLRPVEMPKDFKNADNQQDKTKAPASVHLTFPEKLSKKTIHFFKTNSDITLHILLLAVFKIFLYRYTEKPELLIFSPLLRSDFEKENSQPLENKEKTKARLNNKIILRDFIDPRQSVKELLVETKNKILEAYKNQDYPLDLVFKKKGLDVKDFSFIEKIGFLLKNIHDEEDVAEINFEILFSFLRESETLTGTIKYNPDLFKENTVRQFADRYTYILEAALEDVNQSINRLDILSPGEKQQLLVEFNDTGIAYPEDKTIHQLFEAQVEKSPDAIALVGNKNEIGKEPWAECKSYLSYRALNQKSNQLAYFLRKKGMNPGRIAALIIESSLEMVIGILGILKAGGAYLPIDPAIPRNRLIDMLNDSSAHFLLTREAIIKNLPFSLLQYRSVQTVEPLITAPRPMVKDLDSLQIPDRSYVNYEKYSPYIGQSMMKNSITLHFSRGCVYDCAYCFKIWSNRQYLHRSAQNMFAELNLYYQMGIRRFSFIDDLPNFNIRESSEFYRLIIKNGLNVQLFYPNGLRGDILTKEYIDLMVEAGTVSLDLALETTSPRLQKLVGKNLDLDKLYENMKYIIEQYPHVLLETQLLHGIPTETEEEARNSLDFLKSLYWVHFPYLHVMKIYPNTKMAAIAEEHGVSPEAIRQSDHLGYNELPPTLHFPSSFTHRYQSEFASDYFMSKERLLAVLPHQVRVLTEDELVQKYNSFLPVKINHFNNLLDYVGIQREQLKAEFLPAGYGKVTGLNEKIKAHFESPFKKPVENALKILLIDVSAYFSHDRHDVIYDVVEPSLGLMYLMTHLHRQLGNKIEGKILSSRIDFDSYGELISKVKDYKPQLIGIRTLNFYKEFFHKIVSLLKQWYPDIPIVAGGPYATSSYGSMLQDKNIDMAVLGEGEITFAELVKEILKNNGKLPGDIVLQVIPGLAFVPQGKKFEQEQKNREIVLVDQTPGLLSMKSSENLETTVRAEDLAYILYTSGSTGIPKGVMVQHNHLVNQIHGLKKKFQFDQNLHYILLASNTFDVSLMHIFSPLTTGARLFLVTEEIKRNASKLWQFLEINQVNILNMVPAFLKVLMNYCKDKQLKLRYLFLGGEALPGELYNKLTGVFDVDNIINIYGPTEITINATSYTCKGKEYGETVPIGKPLFNYRVYILDQELNPVFPGGTGELFISGTGVSRGYLNRPELTNQKFLEVQKPFPKKVSGPRRERLYRSGDLCRWLANGNIEFLRRMDQQIKIRGFRVELGEIENCLLHYPGIKEAVVLAREEAAGDKYLCAYIVADKGCDETDVRNFLTKKLPNYMIPLFFVQLDKIPLTVNGKIDRIALPRTALKDNISYIAPRDEIEKKLVELWLDILYGEVLLPSQIQRTIGISDNFFELGGHSLKATILVFRIEKIFNVKIPLSEIFKNPRIKEIAGYIKDAVNWKYEQVELVEKKEYYSLSSAQERLYFLQQMDKDGTVYNLPSIMGVEGIVHKDKLEQSILGLIRRHESLRTSIEIIKEEPVQRIHEQVEFKIEYFNFSTGSTDNLNEKIHPSFIIHHFIRAFDFSKVPLLRVGLAALAEDKHLFMVDMHHIISDGISTQVLVKDFSALYTGNQLPEINLQYKDYAEWQNRGRTDKKIQEQGDYWKKEYEGEIPLLVLPVDFERPVVQGFEGNSINFEINKETSSTLKNLALKAGATLYIMLLALYTILLSKLSSQEDIVIGSPVAGRRHADLEKIIGMFVNTLALRNYPSGEKRFHDFLEEVKEKTLKAFENQEYQYEDLVEKIAVKRDAGRNPLFDSMFSLQNIDSQEIDIPGLKLVPYATESKISKFDLSLTVLEVQDKLLFTFEYSTKLFSETTIERFIAYFLNIINGVIENNRKRISEYEIITEVEKNRILFEFNNTGVVYPKDKTIHQLFAEQAEKFPDRIGIVGADEGEEKKRRREEKKDGGVETLRATSLHITYLQLNEQSDHLAGLLIEKGVKPNTIVGIMMERSVEMIVGILGILKSGGAYLPIDPGYPQERIDYMLKDSNAEILLTNKSEARISKHETNSNDQNTNVQNKNFEGLMVLNFENLNFEIVSNFEFRISDLNPSNLAYIIYTSGSTGKPKGVLIAHSSAVNLFYAMQNEYPLEKSDTFLLKTSYVFDVSVIELFGWYMGGSRLAVLEKDGHKDPRVIVDSIEKHNVSHINFVPSMFSAFIEYLAGGKKHRTASLKYIFLAGEALLPTLIEKFRNLNTGIRLENIYGPTESTVYCSKYSLSGWNGISSIPIGKPLPNIKVYILNKYGFVQPVGVSGELFISGDGVSRGYLNNPELTAEKFVIRHSSLVNGDKRIVNSHRSLVSGKNQKIESPSNLPNDQCPMTNDRFYKTGDLARWLPDGPPEGGDSGGVIEFLGRIDHQVKIRGFRIELGEIENLLLKHKYIKEATVVINEDAIKDKNITAYIISTEELLEGELREYLKEKLPEYIIPAYFIRLEKIPLTPNGKLDKNALPKPELKAERDYVAPRNETEAKLVGLWADLLNIQPGVISIDSNFFQLGGHSLKATVLASRIHKEFNVILPLAEFFKTPTVRGLSKYIKGTIKDVYESITAAEEKEYYVLSSAQKRMYILQQIDLNSTAYNMPEIIPLAEEVDIDRLEDSFKKLIKRHESLRTSFHMIGDQPVQKVHDEVEFKIEIFGRGDPAWSPEIITNFTRPFDLSHAPLLRVGLLKSEAERHLLMVDMHHIISDGVSHEVLVKDFLALQEGKELPPLRLQYKDFAQWQNSPKEIERLHQQMSFWLTEFAGEIPVLEIPTDYSRPISQSFSGNSVDFEISAEETRALKNLALQEGATLFMVLSVAVNILLSKLSGQEEIIIGTPIAGRRHADLEKIIGMFVNTLALRNYPNGEQTFTEFLGDVKERTLLAFENQDYPFEELVDKVSIKRDMGRNPLFDVMFVLQNMAIMPAVHGKTLPGTKQTIQHDLANEYENIIQAAKFDLTFTAVEIEAKILFSIQYCTKLFKKETIERFIIYFKNILVAIVNDDSNLTLQLIDIIAKEEKKQLLFDFNKTGALYPEDKTIHQLFEEQVERTPANIALEGPSLSGGNIQLTYLEVNQKANQLSHVLKHKGVTNNSIIAIMIRRSPEMIVGLWGILKAGGAYLPVDDSYPLERKQQMLKDSAVKLLLVEGNRQFENTKDCEAVFIKDKDLFKGNIENPGIENLGNDLFYIIFTSGSTGLPKGSGIYHRGFMNLIQWYIKEFALNNSDNVLLLTSLSFDLTQKNIYAPLLLGGVLHIPRSDYFEPPVLLHELQINKITWINCTPGMFYKLGEVKEHQYLLSGLRYVFLGGEPISVKMLQAWLESGQCKAELINTYGPTECTDVCTYYRLNDWEHYREKVVPVGKPIYNMQLYILDRYLQIIPIGAAGELFISGDGVGAGYINHCEMAWEKFSIISINGNQCVMCYKTGDLGRWLANGNIEFLGRMDQQIKIRGFRVELGEIESKLLKYPGIKETVVLAWEEENGDKSLCAYIVSEKEYNFVALREFLLQRVPDYMVPYFVRIEKIPLTPNGKVDRKALPAPELKQGEGYETPGNETEKKLVGIWAEILGIDKDIISVNANFFQLGGHSLKATVLASRIHKESNVILPLAELFKTPTIRGLAKYIMGSIKDRYESIMPVEEKEYYDLSFAQKRMYILQQIDLNSTAYNMPDIIPLNAEADIERFEESFKKLIKRHESLRTSFHMIEDQPVQKVHDKVEFKIEYKDLATDKLPQHGQTRTLTEVFGPTFFQKGGFVRPFDLSHAPLLRVGLIKEKGDRHFLMVDMHHIISDGVSHEVLVKEFLALQEGKVLPPLRLQYKDFAQWQNGSKEVDRLHQQMQYWLIEFEGEIPVLELPTDYPRPISQSFAGNNMDFEISSEDTRDLKAVALKCGATLFMVLAAAVNILLSKLSGQEEIIIGTPIAGRRHADLEKIIGMFVNTLALRNYPNGEQTFTEFLGDIKERTLLVFENQEYPFEALVDKLSLKRDVGRNPLFDVMFVLQNIDTRSTGEDEEIPLDYENMVQTAKFDLTFTAVDLSRKTLFSIQYCTKLFKKETIERFINYFKKIVSIVVKESNIRLSDIEIIPEEEKKQVLFDFNNIAAEYPKDKTIHQLFEEQATQTPDYIALHGSMIAWMHDCMDAPMHDCMDAWMDGEVARNVSITYRQLNEQSDRLAGLLIEKGVLPDTIVTIMMGRSIEMIIGIFGILKSGGAYLPIDPEYPQERIDYMLKDSNARILINKSEARISKYETNPNTPKINVPDNKFKDLMVLDFENLNFEFVSSFGFRISDLNSSNLAYVIYTSGTTGKPKGSLIEHRNVVRLLSNDKFQFDFSNSDVWTLFHSFCFDFSVWEMYGALLYGGKLIIVPQITARDTHGFLALLNKENVTVLNQTPSAFYCLIAETLSSSQQERKLYIKYIILGGEALDPLKLKNWHKKYPLTRFINMFGITETTVHVTYKEINNEEIDSNISNIGKPIPTLSVYILDKYLKPVPIGVAGELCVGGKGVCRGYLNRPELTEGKFIENPYKAGDRLYRSADVGRFLGNGDIEYLGRMDHQVKIRGYRIELGEIEHQLIKYPGLKDVVVINQEEKSEDKNLCAYFVSSEELVIPELREFLTRELPDYMIPSYFVQIEKIPLTVNGKVDRKALPAPGVKKSEGYEPPGNETEEKLVKIWSEILGIDKNLIGMNEIFFELGGHSLKATVLASRIHKEFNVILPLGEIFKAPTIKDIGKYIENAKSTIYKNIDWNLVLIKEGLRGDNHLFFIHDGSGEVEGYVEFCNHLTGDFNYWGIRADRLDNLAPRNVTIRELAEKYICSMKKIQPHGPYYIAGWSLGGTIAFEIAAQLEQINEEIVFLALIDSPPPNEDLWKDASKFNLESELELIREYSPRVELLENVKNTKELGRLWISLADYLEASNYDVEIIKKTIAEFGVQALPNFQQLNIKEAIYYLNLGRTLRNARAKYQPSGKIYTNVHYFAASESKNIKKEYWKQYNSGDIMFYEIEGDHFSIFKIPGIAEFARKFATVLENI